MKYKYQLIVKDKDGKQTVLREGPDILLLEAIKDVLQNDSNGNGREFWIRETIDAS